MGDVSRNRRIGAELRRIREEIAGVPALHVAEELGWSQPKLSRIENGINAISQEDLLTLLRRYGASEELTAELIGMISSGRLMEGAWIVRAGGPPRRQGEVATVESRVRRIRNYHMHSIPGQLQSPSFARALAMAGRFGDPEEIVRRRVARQTLLAGSDAPSYEVVLDARALLSWPAPGLIKDQMRFLAERMELPTVTVRIVPLDAVADIYCVVPFVIYDFHRDATSVVFLESQTADIYLSSQTDVDTYTELFARLTTNSLDHNESRQYLDVIARTARRLSLKPP